MGDYHYVTLRDALKQFMSTYEELQEETLFPIQTRLKENWFWPNVFKIQYKEKGLFKTWHTLKAHQKQYKIPAKVRFQGAKEIDTLWIAGREDALQIAAGFKSSGDVAYHIFESNDYQLN